MTQTSLNAHPVNGLTLNHKNTPLHLETQAQDLSSRQNLGYYTLQPTLAERIGQEIALAKSTLSHVKQAVSFFGGARLLTTDPVYAQAFKMAEYFSSKGISVISGGGPGIMEAANRGAEQGRSEWVKSHPAGDSIGLNITLPQEKTHNPHQSISITFEHFASRKVAFCAFSDAFIVFPGGYGTLDELGEILTLMQTGKMPVSPIILYQSDFWNPMIQWMDHTMRTRGLIGENDLDLMKLADSPEEVFEILSPHFQIGS